MVVKRGRYLTVLWKQVRFYDWISECKITICFNLNSYPTFGHIAHSLSHFWWKSYPGALNINYIQGVSQTLFHLILIIDILSIEDQIALGLKLIHEIMNLFVDSIFVLWNYDFVPEISQSNYLKFKQFLSGIERFWSLIGRYREQNHYQMDNCRMDKCAISWIRSDGLHGKQTKSYFETPCTIA